jgi:hypothetical protein
VVYQATQDVVRRVLPLLELISQRSIDKARLLQYFAARSGIDWGVLELVAVDEEEPTHGASSRVLVVRDPASGEEHRIRYPSCLPEGLEPALRAEYQRRAKREPLTTMDPALFAHFFAESHCRSCRWQGEEHGQVHRECHFAGRPVNYEPLPQSEVRLALPPG